MTVRVTKKNGLALCVGTHSRRALLVNLGFNVKVVRNGHMTNALPVFHTLFVQIVSLTKFVCITK